MSETSPRDELVQHLPAMRAFAISLTRNGSLADDMVQDTLVKAWTNIEKFEPGTNMRAWLFTILRNTYYSSQADDGWWDYDASHGWDASYEWNAWNEWKPKWRKKDDYKKTKEQEDREYEEDIRRTIEESEGKVQWRPLSSTADREERLQQRYAA